MLSKREEATVHADTRRKPESVPYVVYEDATADKQWVIKKLVKALIVALVLLFASNLAWLWVFQSYDYSTEETVTTVNSDGEGVANYTGGDGGVVIGESDSQKNGTDKNEE